MLSAGINIGYGHTKIRTGKQYITFPSVSAPANKTFTGLGLDRKTRIVHLKGMDYEVGQDASLLTTDLLGGKVCRPRWLDSIPYQTFRQATIDILYEQAESQEQEWAVVLGIAVEHFKNEAYVERMRDSWLGDHKTSDGKPIRINMAHVVPEPMGAYWSLVLSDKELKQRSKQSTVLVVDLGYFTTDWIGIYDNRLNPALSSGKNIGMYDLYLELQKHLQSTHGLTMDLVRLESMVRENRPLHIHGQDIALEHVLSPAKEKVMPKIVNAFLQGIGDGAGDQLLIFLTGGGASLLEPYLREAMDHVEIFRSGDSQRDNADGYYMLAQVMQQSVQEKS